MEKLDSALCQWIVLYTHYFNFHFSYLHTFYKPITLLHESATERVYYKSFETENQEKGTMSAQNLTYS